MPTYNFRYKNTNQEFSLVLSMKEREEYLNINQNVEQIFTVPPAIGDPVKLGVSKADNMFRNRLREIKDAHVGSTINPGNITEL